MSPADLWVDAGIEPSACQVCGRKNCEDSEHASEGIDVHDVSPPEVEKDGEAGKKSQATILVQLARAMGAELFHDDDTAYLHVPVGGHCETHRLRSRSGRAWLASLFFERLNRAPGSQAITDAMNTLEALAVRGPEHRVYVPASRGRGSHLPRFGGRHVASGRGDGDELAHCRECAGPISAP